MTKNKTIKIIAMLSSVGLALGWSTGAVFAQQNLINNGSFESGAPGYKNFPEWDAIGPADNISYYLGTDGTTLGSGAEMYVVIGTSFGIDYSQDVQLTDYEPNSSNALPYQKFTSIITATNANPILSFHGFDATSAILLDNVSMTLVVPSPPQLRVKPAPTNMLAFTWTAPTNGYRLQANASPGTTNWTTLTNAPVAVGSSNQIVLPAPGSNLFYRLTLP
jgi:hypothetical protein